MDKEGVTITDRYILNPHILEELVQKGRTGSDSGSQSETSIDPLSLRIRALREGEKGIDFELLKQREDILFFDEAVLYQVTIDRFLP